MKRLRFFAPLLLFYSWTLLNAFAEPSLGKADAKQVEDFEYTTRLLLGDNGGLIGIEMNFRNVSKTAPLKFRRKAGTVPISVNLRDGANAMLTQRFVVAAKEDTPPSGTSVVTMEPGKTLTFFLPIAALFDVLPSADRFEHCYVLAQPDIELPLEIVTAARERARRLSPSEFALRAPGIDTPFRGAFFSNVLITRKSLAMDAVKAHTEAQASEKK
jgi:hypothetical protein